MTNHVCGAGMAFLGFSLSLIIGLLVGNSFVAVVTRAVVVLFLFYVLGCLLAGLGRKVILQNFQAETEAIAEAIEREVAADTSQKTSTETSVPPTESAVTPELSKV